MLFPLEWQTSTLRLWEGLCSLSSTIHKCTMLCLGSSLTNLRDSFFWKMMPMQFLMPFLSPYTTEVRPYFCLTKNIGPTGCPLSVSDYEFMFVELELLVVSSQLRKGQWYHACSDWPGLCGSLSSYFLPDCNSYSSGPTDQTSSLLCCLGTGFCTSAQEIESLYSAFHRKMLKLLQLTQLSDFQAGYLWFCQPALPVHVIKRKHFSLIFSMENTRPHPHHESQLQQGYGLS